MRIVAGRHKGRALATPAGADIRPTADRVRESIFNVLVHGLGVELDGATVVDFFAGTGALGLEALSRGAAHAVFVETTRGALDTIKINIETLGERDRTQIVRRDATRLGAPPAGMTPATLAFLDPPYGQDLAAPALAAAADRGWLAPGAICVVELRRSEKFQIPAGFIERDMRTYGGTTVRFLAAPE